jgi:hypothetical protein
MTHSKKRTPPQKWVKAAQQHQLSTNFLACPWVPQNKDGSILAAEDSLVVVKLVAGTGLSGLLSP